MSDSDTFVIQFSPAVALLQRGRLHVNDSFNLCHIFSTSFSFKSNNYSALCSIKDSCFHVFKFCMFKLPASDKKF